MDACLYGVATSVPRHTATQRHSHQFMHQVVRARAEADEYDRAALFLDGIHEGCGIERRYSVIDDFTKSDPEQFEFFPKNWALQPFPGTAARMEIYEKYSVELSTRAARDALKQAGVSPREVTHLVVVTCTGAFAPGPDILLVQRLGLRPDTRRTVVGFMGCYGAFNGLRLAEQILAFDEDAVVLQVCVELCSLHFQRDLDPETIVGNCLFGDGCAAAVWAGEGRGGKSLGKVATSHCHITDDSLDQMQWHIGDFGFSMVLDVAIPATLLEGGARFVDVLLDRARLHKDDVAGWLVHPGGPRIIDAVRDAAGLDEREMTLSRSVLRDFGNMSSATILFVLQRYLERRNKQGPMVLLGFGPGLTMEGAVLR